MSCCYYSLSRKFREIYTTFQEFTVKINAILTDLKASTSFTVWDKLYTPNVHQYMFLAALWDCLIGTISSNLDAKNTLVNTELWVVHF